MTLAGCQDHEPGSECRHRQRCQQDRPTRRHRSTYLERPQAHRDPSTMTLLAELEDFVRDHRPHGTLTEDATEPAWNGYLFTVACPCGVVFERWITPQHADADLLRLACRQGSSRVRTRAETGLTVTRQGISSLQYPSFAQQVLDAEGSAGRDPAPSDVRGLVRL